MHTDLILNAAKAAYDNFRMTAEIIAAGKVDTMPEWDKIPQIEQNRIESATLAAIRSFNTQSAENRAEVDEMRNSDIATTARPAGGR